MNDRDSSDALDAIRSGTLDAGRFVRLTLKGKVRDRVETDWQSITVRPVELKNGYHWQFVYFDGRQSVTQNYAGDDAERALDEALAIPYSAVHLRTTEADLHMQRTKKGKAILHRSDPPTGTTPDLAHDHGKDLPIPDTQPDPYLQAVGIMNAGGRVRREMRAKFTQVNEFLKLLEHTGELESFTDTPAQIVDFGCGSAYLTLATYHYLNDIRGIPARLDGVDVNTGLIAKNTDRSAELGYGDACFTSGAILDYVPERSPDIVMALHACDTATDDALYQGIRHSARIILAAPCCHHHLHRQLQTVDPMRPIMRHGILKKRMADILTDSFRALILRICGYSTDVIEFVATEHTDRNLMIRAVRREPVDTAAFAAEYRDLKAFWGVTPYLEDLLGDDFRALVK
jgi:SAM-dependent methyltransferase